VLAVIGANAGLLTDAVPVGHPDRELVDEIESAVQRAAGLTRQLLALQPQGGHRTDRPRRQLRDL
jgi:hypothetical protein